MPLLVNTNPGKIVQYLFPPKMGSIPFFFFFFFFFFFYSRNTLTHHGLSLWLRSSNHKVVNIHPKGLGVTILSPIGVTVQTLLHENPFLYLYQGLLYHRTCKPDFLFNLPSLNSYINKGKFLIQCQYHNTVPVSKNFPYFR